MEIFSQRLKEERKAMGLTQQQLADTLDISRRTYAHYEQIGTANGREPSLKTICKIADFFDVTVDYLLGRSDF